MEPDVRVRTDGIVTDRKEAAEMREFLERNTRDFLAKEGPLASRGFVVVDISDVQYLGRDAAYEFAGKWLGRLRRLGRYDAVFFITGNESVVNALQAGLANRGDAAYVVVRQGIGATAPSAVGDVTTHEARIIELARAHGAINEQQAAAEISKDLPPTWDHAGAVHERLKGLVRKGLLIESDGQFEFPLPTGVTI